MAPIAGAKAQASAPCSPSGATQQEFGGEYQVPSAQADYVIPMIIPVVDIGFAIFAISALFVPLSAIAFAG
jgi:hypothetical protein